VASLIPIAKALYLCDDILSDPTRVKPHLIGVLNTVRVPSFPHDLPQLCIFARLIDGLGQVRCRVQVTRASDRAVIYRSPERILDFPDRHQTRYFILRMQQVHCPAPGEYWVEFYCNNEFIDDAVLRLELVEV
jgi:hypothetical protein